ncbi:MAG: glycosyltransferase family 1 protein, partial [Candidatus Omnitrophica bacterium]|nr:glycosyltransferase family 1 protein [Candidatus Omnitrophota bacterium]
IYRLTEESIEGLSSKLEEVLALSPERREALGASARAHVLENYTWRHYVDRVRDFLTCVVKVGDL